MNRQVAVGFVLFGLVVGLAWIGAAPRSAAQGELQPITAANAAQVRPVLSVPGWYDYHGFSPDGSLLATSSLVIPPHLWRIADGSAVPISAPGSYKAFSPHGELLAVTAGWTGTMIWDMAADREILSVEGTFYAFSTDGAYLVTKGEDAWYLWDVSTGEQLEILNWDTDYGWLRFSPDGSWLAWSGFDGVVNVWDLRAHDRIAELYKRATNGLFTADSALLITRHDNTLSGWDTATWSVRYSYLVGDDNYLALSADGSVLIARNCFNQGDCRVHLFRLAGTELSQACTLPIAPESKPYDPPWLSLSPDGRYLFSRVDVGPAVLWDLTTCDPLPLPLANEDRVFSGFFNPDASLLFVQVLADRKHPHSLTALHIIEMGTWNELAVLAGNGFILSPDSSTLISVVEGFTLLYGVPDSARPVGRVLIPAAILPSAITLRAAPDPNAEVVGTASGFVLAGGRNGAYVYLADLDGWVNGGEEYIVLRDNLPLDYLPEYGPAEVVAFVPPPTSIPYPTSTPTPLPTRQPALFQLPRSPRQPRWPQRYLPPPSPHSRPARSRCWM